MQKLQNEAWYMGVAIEMTGVVDRYGLSPGSKFEEVGGHES